MFKKIIAPVLLALVSFGIVTAATLPAGTQIPNAVLIDPIIIGSGGSPGTGTVTSVTGGTGLTGGTITTSGTLAVSYGTTSGTAAQGNDSRIASAVQSVSIVTQSGVSGTCTATTTPACTIALGGITPTSITTATGSYSGIITWPNDGDQQYMGNTDVSKFHVGGWAANSGSIYTLLGSTDFAHYYFCHNVATNPSTGAFLATDDNTSTSYCELWTDNGYKYVFQAPATGNSSPPTFNSTPSYKLNLLTGAAAFNGLLSATSGVTTTSINGVTTDSTTNKPVTAASLAGGTLPASVTTLNTSGLYTAASGITSTAAANSLGATVFSGAITGNQNASFGTIGANGLAVTGAISATTFLYNYGNGGITSNNAVGYNALSNNTTGSYNTTNGVGALYSNTTGASNTANGVYALYSNTTGASNTANGAYALQYNTTGASNAANGVYALYNNTTGNYNTANGVYALYSNTTGASNTANGVGALYSNTTGIYNAANGVYALYYNTTGNYNTANGAGALQYNTTGIYNTATSASGGLNPANDIAQYRIVADTNMVLVGYGATKNNVATLNNSIAIGNNAQVTQSNQVMLGNTTITRTDLNGAVYTTGSLTVTGAISANGSITQTGSTKIQQLATPATPTGTPSGTGGTVAAGSNYAKIVALDILGNTLPSTESSVVTTSGATSSIAWAWTATTGAASYQIWVSATTGTEAYYYTSTTNSYLQTTAIGAGGTSGTIPSSNITGQLTIAGSATVSGTLNTLSFVAQAASRAVNTGTTAITIPSATSTSYLSGISVSGVTITLSAPSGDGERRRIVFGGASTGITWAVTSPATAVVGLPTTVTAGQAIEIVYNSVAGTPTNSAATSWYLY